jgi:hypothetical protein
MDAFSGDDDRFVEDLGRLHIDAEFEWIREGRLIDGLRCRFRSREVSVYGMPATVRRDQRYVFRPGHRPVDVVPSDPRRKYVPKDPTK